MMTCWTRSTYGDDEKNKESIKETFFLTQQLKFAREQIDKKQRLNEDLSGELRKLQAELELRSKAVRDARELAHNSSAELRASAHAREIERSELQEQVATLEAALARFSGEAPAVGAYPAVASSAPAVAVHAPQEAGGEAEKLKKLTDSVEELQHVVAQAAEREAALVTERARLQAALSAEKELHEEAVRQVKAQRVKNKEKSAELRQELHDLSAIVAQKEEDILNVQFEMAALVNRLGDQTALVAENADAFQSASEELADKDELLEKALQKQEEILGQMNELVKSSQGKVSSLTKELESCQTSYKTLEEQSQSIRARLEADRDALSAELERARAELATLRAEMQRQEAATVERCNQLELQLASASVDAERRKGELRAVSSVVASPTSPQSPTARSSAQRIWDLEEKLAVSDEKLASTEAKSSDLAAALELSKLLERQANERLQAQERLAALRLLEVTGAGADGFQAAAPRLASAADASSASGATSVGDAAPQANGIGGGGSSDRVAKVGQVLIKVAVNLGGGNTGTLEIAPWHTSSDFDQIVKDFLEEHRIRPIFASSLVQFLEEVEREATVFPLSTTANLAELYSRFG